MSFLDLTQVEDAKFEAVKGLQNAQIVEQKVLDEKDEKQQWELTFQVLDGQFSNRKVKNRYWLKHPNKKAVLVAQQNLKDLCVCAGKDTNLENANDIVGAIVQAMFSTREYNGKEYSEIKYFKKAISQEDESSSIFG